MMLWLYRLSLALFYLLARLLSPFYIKARRFVEGQRIPIVPIKSPRSAWFHFASLGEFEQGRPVLEIWHERHPSQPIVITFFSPSGYEVRKNYPLATYVYYLPLDSPRHAASFIDTINPAVAFFTKYDYWFFYFQELSTREIPLYVIAALFKPRHFQGPYGRILTRMLRGVTTFFVQDEQSALVLQQAGFKNTLVTGDTRFDRVYANRLHNVNFPLIDEFCKGSCVLVAGSTWPADDALLVRLIQYSEKRSPPGRGDASRWKFIIAPHEVDETHVERLIKTLTVLAVRYSHLTAAGYFPPTATPSANVLILDTVGMLSKVYRYGDAAYVGGGFGKAIHNIQEPAVFGLPLLFGPHYARFKEAVDLVKLGGAFTLRDFESLQNHFIALQSPAVRAEMGGIGRAYMLANVGATEKIMNALQQLPPALRSFL